MVTQPPPPPLSATTSTRPDDTDTEGINTSHGKIPMLFAMSGVFGEPLHMQQHAAPPCLQNTGASQKMLRRLLQPLDEEEKQLRTVVDRAVLQLATTTTHTSELWYIARHVKSALGTQVVIRTVRDHTGMDCCHFIRVVHQHDADTAFVIDPAFRDKFQIARPSQRYTAVLAAAPAVMVCSEDSLKRSIRLMCSEMSASFDAAGIDVPPWRSLKTMLHKWLPAQTDQWSDVIVL